jgi:hypothetical protein
LVKVRSSVFDPSEKVLTTVEEPSLLGIVFVSVTVGAATVGAGVGAIVADGDGADGWLDSEHAPSTRALPTNKAARTVPFIVLLLVMSPPCGENMPESFLDPEALHSLTISID